MCTNLTLLYVPTKMKVFNCKEKERPIAFECMAPSNLDEVCVPYVLTSCVCFGHRSRMELTDTSFTSVPYHGSKFLPLLVCLNGFNSIVKHA